MADETIPNWNQKTVHANQTILAQSEEITKAQRKAWKATYQAQFKDIVEAEEELQHNWDSREARERLNEAQAVCEQDSPPPLIPSSSG